MSGLNDDFSRTVCYDSMARALRAEAMARPRKLVETLAEDMGKVCLKEFGARHVVVTLRKFILPRTDSVFRNGACFPSPVGKRFSTGYPSAFSSGIFFRLW